ncbi:MAG: hypothetical protein AB1422_07540 [bacterium]
MENKQKKERVLEIDPEKIKEGMCEIVALNKKKFSVCKEEGKLKIFPISQQRKE